MGESKSAMYQRRHREKMRKAGFKKAEVNILPENFQLLKRVERELRKVIPLIYFGKGEPFMSFSVEKINAETDWVFTLVGKNIYFGQQKGFHEGNEGVYLIVGDYQIIVRTTPLWTVDDAPATVNGMPFSEYLLRVSEQYMLQHFLLTGKDYVLNGSLSAKSSYEDVILELDQIVLNTVKSYEMFAEITA